MKQIFLLFATLNGCGLLFGQFTPPASTTQSSLTLTFQSAVSNTGSVVYNPLKQLYYIARCGNTSFPLETHDNTGAVLNQTTTGLDTRGVWWNPNTLQVERNLFASLGWGAIDLDVNGMALTTTTTFFTGQLQPNTQSIGAYDYNANHVLFYNGGSTVFIYNRNTGIQLSTLTLSGATFTNVNNNSIIYTGQSGFEIGLLDFTAKKVLFFNISTGNFSAETTLPAAAPTSTQFRFSYANGKVWLFDQPTVTWLSYPVFPESPLPYNAMLFSVNYIPENHHTLLQWEIESDYQVQYFEIERSENGVDFANIGRIASKENNSKTQSYQFADNRISPNRYFYRLKQVDANNAVSYSPVIEVYVEDRQTIQLYPTCFSDHITIDIPHIEETCTLTLHNTEGQIVRQFQQNGNGDWKMQLDLSTLPSGIYLYKINHDGSFTNGKLVKK